jgi:hypothetical protein
MNWLRAAALGVVLAALAGCVPWPHHYLTAPQIRGTVSRDGKPVAGAHVRLADLMTVSRTVSPAALTQEAVTDAQGHFSVGPIRRFSWQAHVPLASVYQHNAPWGLQMSNGGAAWQPGWLSDYSLFAEVSKMPLTAQCDLGAPFRSSVIEGDLSLVGYGRCQLAISESDK